MRDELLQFGTNSDENTIYDIDQLVPRGNYEDPESLVDTINRIYEEYAWRNPNMKIEYPPKLFYLYQSHKISIRLGIIVENNIRDYFYPIFSTYLAQILGLLDSQGRQYPLSANKSKIVSELIEHTNFNPYINKNIPVVIAEINPLKRQNNSENQTQQIASLSKAKVKSQSPVNNSQENVTVVEDDVKTNTTNQTQQITGLVLNANQTNCIVEEEDNGQSSSIRVQQNVISSSIQKRDINEHFHTTVYVTGLNEVVLHPISSLYVYSYIIKPVFVGNVEASLLRIVEIPNDKKFGETVEIKYKNPQYHPLVSHEFDSIEIDIRDDTNQPINFAFGKTVVTLHFRKKAKNVFEALFFR